MPKKEKSKKTKSAVQQTFTEKDASGQQEYGELLKFLGSNWTEVYCADGCKRRCHIRGKLQRCKKGPDRMNPGDTVLISKRDTKSGDILLKYPTEQARAMKKAGKIVINVPDADKVQATADIGFEFGDQPDQSAEAEFDFENL
jgi:initiation factor 1A